ncbi:MAG: hypothetical protein AAF218_01615 [Pseudomonadota bacterium]
MTDYDRRLAKRANRIVQKVEKHSVTLVIGIVVVGAFLAALDTFVL